MKSTVLLHYKPGGCFEKLLQIRTVFKFYFQHFKITKIFVFVIRVKPFRNI